MQYGANLAVEYVSALHWQQKLSEVSEMVLDKEKYSPGRRIKSDETQRNPAVFIIDIDHYYNGRWQCTV